VFVFVVYVVRQKWRKMEDCETGKQDDFTLWSAITKEIPTSAGFSVLVLTVVFGCLGRFRRRVVIFDDITRAKCPANGNQRNFIRNNLLKTISGYEKRVNVVIVTSNEGLRWVFSDTNSTVRNVLTMPQATAGELVDILRRAGGLHVYRTTVHQVAERYGKEHGLSTRFWLTKTQGTTVGNILLENNGHNLLNRASLWDVAMNVDLKCEVSFALITLGMSPMVHLDLYKGVIDGAVDKAKSLLKTDQVPHRLVLISLLVATITKEELAVHKERLLELLPTRAVEPVEFETQSYRKFIEPLCQAISPAPTLSHVWVKDSVSGTSFEVIPLRPTIDGLKDAIKAKSELKGPAWVLIIKDSSGTEMDPESQLLPNVKYTYVLPER